MCTLILSHIHHRVRTPVEYIKYAYRNQNTMERVRDHITYPTWERYTVLSKCIGKLNIRDRRRIFQIARTVDIGRDNTLLPSYGFTLTEFSVWYTLGDRRNNKTV